MYAMGLLGEGERKSAEPIAARACGDRPRSVRVINEIDPVPRYSYSKLKATIDDFAPPTRHTPTARSESWVRSFSRGATGGPGMDEIHRRLKGPWKEETQELVDLILAGKSFASPGMRDTVLVQVAGILARVAPATDPYDLAALLRPSLAAMDRDASDAPTLDQAADKIRRCQQKEVSAGTNPYLNQLVSVDQLAFVIPRESYYFKTPTGCWDLSSPIKKESAVKHLISEGTTTDEANLIVAENRVILAHGTDCAPGKAAVFDNEGRKYLNSYVPPKIVPAEGAYPTITKIMLTLSRTSAEVFLDAIDDHGIDALIENYLEDTDTPAGDIVCWDFGDKGVNSEIVYRAYRFYCKQNGYKAMSSTTFGKELSRCRPGVSKPRVHKDGQRYYVYQGLSRLGDAEIPSARAVN
jgi:hypothetical protein